MNKFSFSFVGVALIATIIIVGSLFYSIFPEAKNSFEVKDYNFYSKGWHDENLVLDDNSEIRNFYDLNFVIKPAGEIEKILLGSNDQNLNLIENKESIVVVEKWGTFSKGTFVNKRFLLYSQDKNTLCFVYDGNNWNECLKKVGEKK